jgi:hypothetical protein
MCLGFGDSAIRMAQIDHLTPLLPVVPSDEGRIGRSIAL